MLGDAVLFQIGRFLRKDWKYILYPTEEPWPASAPLAVLTILLT